MTPSPDPTPSPTFGYVEPHQRTASSRPLPPPTPSPTPEERLPTITYKPGWTFTWGDTYEDGRVWLEIHVEGPDSKGWDRDTMLPRSVDFAFLVPTPFYPEWIRNRIAGIEDHEIREWLRIDGRLEFDPHV